MAWKKVVHYYKNKKNVGRRERVRRWRKVLIFFITDFTSKSQKPKPTSNNLNRSGVFFIWNAKCTHSHTYIYINIYIYVSFTKLQGCITSMQTSSSKEIPNTDKECLKYLETYFQKIGCSFLLGSWRIFLPNFYQWPFKKIYTHIGNTHLKHTDKMARLDLRKTRKKNTPQ